MQHLFLFNVFKRKKRRCNAFPSGQVLSQSDMILCFATCFRSDSFCIFLSASFITNSLVSLSAHTQAHNSRVFFTTYQSKKYHASRERFTTFHSPFSLQTKIYTLSLLVRACYAKVCVAALYCQGVTYSCQHTNLTGMPHKTPTLCKYYIPSSCLYIYPILWRSQLHSLCSFRFVGSLLQSVRNNCSHFLPRGSRLFYLFLRTLFKQYFLPFFNGIFSLYISILLHHGKRLA